MGSTGKAPAIVEEPITGTPIIYGTAMIREDSIDIDGYSNKKTLKGALADLAKAIEKYNKGEADALRSSIKFNEIEQVNTVPEGGVYILEYEEVPSASNWNEETEEMEYKPAHWYIHTRFGK